jgi:hypothetical protein
LNLSGMPADRMGCERRILDPTFESWAGRLGINPLAVARAAIGFG